MTLFFNSISGILTLVVITAVGVAATRAGWITQPVTDFITKFTIRVAIPATLFINALDSLSADQLAREWALLPIPVLTILANILAAWAVTRAHKAARPRRGVFITCFSMANSIFIGLPVCTAIFGQRAAPYVTFYYMANTVLFWTLCAPLIAADGDKQAARGLSRLKNLLSPPVIGFLCGLALVLAGWNDKLPVFADSAVRLVANLNTPLCMLFLGSVIAKLGFKGSLALGGEGRLVILGRFVLCPAIMMAACLAAGAPPLAAGVFTAVSAMPVMNQAMIVAYSSGADYEFCSRIMAASVLLMAVFIPLLTLVIGGVFAV